ncbi:hypothetical protein ACO0RG_001454 [Hanseniaspora osmophila]|uniref:ATP synthase subunit K, mitochondrial n=1 Tax=Hanseniaspora osmophila TaxID=56408 RepID=A0A1E5R0B8_9ASCO|nr:ATP synthase subunit K, mitochondrial [Hanseniaspora osmophila]
MGAAYNILGRSVLPHQLALGTFGAVIFFLLPNPFASKPQVQSVPIKAGSKDEEDFIKKYLQEHSTTEKK